MPAGQKEATLRGKNLGSCLAAAVAMGQVASLGQTARGDSLSSGDGAVLPHSVSFLIFDCRVVCGVFTPLVP